MANINDFLYLYKDNKSSLSIMSGIAFKEFALGISRPLNLLLIRHGFYKGKLHKPSFFTYVANKELPLLIEDDIYWYGDFCWVDCKDEKSLEKLSPQQIAELLFMAQTLKPLFSPYFDSINNKFVYLGHDDEVVTYLYCRDNNEFINMLAAVIQNKIKILCRRKTSLINESVLTHIAKMSSRGLYIDFTDTSKSHHAITFKLKLIGKKRDMSEIINNPLAPKKEYPLTYHRTEGWRLYQQ